MSKSTILRMSANKFHYLAHEIERVHAKDRARLINANRPRGQLKTTWQAEFDPLAATCLADPIEKWLEGDRP